jgi:hypothetical protein
MSLDKIKLPHSLISDLYRNSLVLPGKDLQMPAPEEKNRSEQRQVLRVLGNNLKKTILIAEDPDASFLPEHHLNFLIKILEACKMNLADVAIINLLSYPIGFSELNRELSPRIVILFGLEPTRIKLPFHIPAFKIQEYDHCQFLFVPALNELNQDNDEGKLLKSKLWLCLKNLFGV